jgi:hypothetical protein
VSWQVGQAVAVEIGGAELVGAIVSFPSNRRVEYPTRPVVVKVGPAEYVTVDLSRVAAVAS